MSAPIIQDQQPFAELLAHKRNAKARTTIFIDLYPQKLLHLGSIYAEPKDQRSSANT
ncbi:MAG TPA: hypothetical protein VFJ51_06235 [Nitrososphaeraceae archaeon]|nr:hypothetical protein [Nitrososphaeraceae archaeon]